uniref:Uncharacterized protein n=1 Tax=Siphoviridae sp. ctJ0s2 TaxID=2827834 RepID=A0A8S5TEZ8_9CAUD|nr:MAG TPA: hypothetical protein [Siphoviridae sp. ctJ0s2]
MCARKFISVRTEIYRRAHGDKFPSAGKIFCLPTKVRFPPQENASPSRGRRLRLRTKEGPRLDTSRGPCL